MSAPSPTPPTTVRLQRGMVQATRDAEALAGRLVEEMTRRWQQGERPLAEEFLARHPELRAYPEAAADLIYEEVCLRQQHGEEIPAEEVLRRFPEWRAPLAVLLDCHRLLGPAVPTPRFPKPGEALGDFRLLDELGRGSRGRVLLAAQLSLAGRPVVLKLTPCDAEEHLSLARLQHTFIVPLYSVQDFPARGLRALCMPYFGGATLAQILQCLAKTSPSHRTGAALVEALDRSQPPSSVPVRAEGPTRQSLARASYVQAVCWIGACLADALHYAHERGLLHLDLKPSNVLLTADGTPMLLDFHLAQPPLVADAPSPLCLGGTPGYMSPEQAAALTAIQLGQDIVRSVDGRSDVYSLGVVLFESLAGWRPGTGAARQTLRRRNPEVSPGLADLIGKCLADRPEDRYAAPADLAADLRRHLADLPLRGVRNRSLRERWRKWRGRRPNGLARAGMLLTVLGAMSAVLIGAAGHLAYQTDQARAALEAGLAHQSVDRPGEAVRAFQRGLSLARGVPFQGGLVRELEQHATLAEQARDAAERAGAARELRILADRVRFLYGTGQLSEGETRRLDACCRALWEKRGLVVNCFGESQMRQQVREDLLDLAILWADLRCRIASPRDRTAGRAAALTVLTQAEELFGPNLVLDEERRFYTPSTGQSVSQRRPTKAWEHYALGRSLMRAGDLRRAAPELEEALRLQPQGLWPNFYLGVCAHRLGRHEEAVAAFSVCIGSAPDAAGCFYNRGLAYAALGRADLALLDFDSALRLGPTLAPAALNRGLIHFQGRRYLEALGDLQLAMKLGADPAVVCYNLALVKAALGDRAAARDDLHRVLQCQPGCVEAQKLLRALQPGS